MGCYCSMNNWEEVKECQEQTFNWTNVPKDWESLKLIKTFGENLPWLKFRKILCDFNKII